RIAGLEILRDGEPIHPASWNHALPIDGGTYTFTARAPGVAAWSATRTIRPEADAVTVEIPRLDDPRVAGGAKPVAKPAAPAPAPAPAAKPAALPPAPTPAAAPGPAQLAERHAREVRPEPS